MKKPFIKPSVKQLKYLHTKNFNPQTFAEKPIFFVALRKTKTVMDI